MKQIYGDFIQKMVEKKITNLHFLHRDDFSVFTQKTEKPSEFENQDGVSNKKFT